MEDRDSMLEAISGSSPEKAALELVFSEALEEGGLHIRSNGSFEELEDNVFCGPSCVFTNVINPRSFINRKNEYKKTLVQTGATIGANATIVCGVRIGKFSLIGAGAVITKDVKDFSIMAGNPARKIGWVSTRGYKLNNNLQCPETGEEFFLDGEVLRKK